MIQHQILLQQSCADGLLLLLVLMTQAEHLFVRDAGFARSTQYLLCLWLSLQHARQGVG